MKKVIGCCGIALFIIACYSSAEELDLTQILNKFSSPDFIYQPFPAQTHQNSTYDRTGGNEDGDYFLEKNHQRAVVAKINGPGIITRIYTAHPLGILNIYLDDKKEPLISAHSSEFFSGAIYPFSEPIVGKSTGAYCYFPIPFSKSARIELEPDPDKTTPFPFGRYWQVEWLELTEAYPLKTLTLPISEPEKIALDNFKKYLNSLKKFEIPPQLEKISFESEIAPQERIVIAQLNGPGIIRKLALTLIPDNQSSQEHFLKAKIFGYWEEEENPSIIAKVSSFFANPINSNSPKIFIKRTEQGGEIFLPMPFSRSARFELQNPSQIPGKVKMELWVDKKEPKSPWRFHCLEREQKLTKNSITQNLDHQSDYLLLSSKGEGRFIGTVLWVFNKFFLWWGEGDETFFINDELRWHGTGTEDYFDGSYLHLGDNLFTSALAKDLFGKGYAGLNLMYKFHLLDPIYFQENIIFRLEYGSGILGINDLDNWYGSVVYWYQAEPHSDFSQMLGQELNLSEKIIKKEINQTRWNLLPRSSKIAIIIYRMMIGALALLLIFWLSIKIIKWQNKKEKKN